MSNNFSGAIEHRVEFFWRLGEIESTPELGERLLYEAERRSHSQILEGFIEGELLAYLDNGNKDLMEITGWWKLVKPKNQY